MPFLVLVVGSMMVLNYNPSTLTVPPIEPPPTLEISDLQNIALADAQSYGLNPEHFFKVIKCESGFSATSTSKTDDFGIVQINAKAHPNITKEQMFDPVWSLNWMAQEWSAGRQREWVCYQRIYG